VNYYNENDSKAAAWLQELINEKLIPQGKIDTRSIRDVCPEDLRDFVQCHFFAGVAGWSLALQLAGWPEDRPVWSGSCPCQSFSCAGKQKGVEDPRHLWPDFFRLIRECRPDFVFGEQVEGAIRHGWLDGIQRDMEGEGYAVGHCVLGAHSVGAPHIRQRLFWVANAHSEQNHTTEPGQCVSCAGLQSSRLANAEPIGRQQQPVREPAGIQHQAIESEECVQPIGGHGPGVGEHGGVGDTIKPRLEGGTEKPMHAKREQVQVRRTCDANFWSDAIWHQCRDGKARRISPEREILMLATRVSASLGGYGSQNSTNERKEVNGTSEKTRSDQVLHTVQEAVSAEALQQDVGGHGGIHSQKILRPSVHGDELRRADQGVKSAQQSAPVSEGCLGELRELRRDETASRPPHRPESAEQHPGELADTLRVLSQAAALATKEGCQSTPLLRLLRDSCSEAGNVPKALSTLEEIWRSILNQEACDWSAGQVRACADRIATYSSFPLTSKQPNRVMLLRGFGNAIVPHVAAEFIKAVM